MLRSFLTLLFGFIFSLSLSAQTAQEWLDRAAKTYSDVTSYYIKFQVEDNGGGTKETGELFANKEKYSLTVMDIRQIYDGKTLFTITYDDKEVTISKPESDSDDLLTPTKVLRMYKNGFTLSLDKKITVDNNKLQYIKLTPDTSSDILYMLVAVNTGNNTLTEYKEVYKSGATRTIGVEEYLENLIVPKALFKFDKQKYEKQGYIVTEI